MKINNYFILFFITIFIGTLDAQINLGSRNILLLKFAVNKPQNFRDNQNEAIYTILEEIKNKVPEPYQLRPYEKGCDPDSLLGIVLISYDFGKHNFWREPGDTARTEIFKKEIKYHIRMYTKMSNGYHSNWEKISAKWSGYDDYFIFKKVPLFKITEKSPKLIMYWKWDFSLNGGSADFDLKVDQAGYWDNSYGDYSFTYRSGGGWGINVYPKLPFYPTFGLRYGGRFGHIEGFTDNISNEDENKILPNYDPTIEEFSFDLWLLYSIPLSKFPWEKSLKKLTLSAGPSFCKATIDYPVDNGLNDPFKYNQFNFVIGVSYESTKMLFSGFNWGLHGLYSFPLNSGEIDSPEEITLEASNKSYFKLGLHVGCRY